MTEQPGVAQDLHTTAGKLADLRARHEQAVHAGSAKALERQAALGKGTARGRLEQLLDPGSFVELDTFARSREALGGPRPYGDGMVCGYGTIDGRRVYVYSQDFTVAGGSAGAVFGEKIAKVMEQAMAIGCPVIGINDSGGARIQEGVVSIAAFGEVMVRNVDASGVIPQISLIMGPCAGGAAYSPVLTDFVVMVDGTSNMFVTGPDVIRAVMGEDISSEELGGARTHSTISGNSHYLASDETDAIDYVKALLSYLPANNLEKPPTTVADEVPDEPTLADLALDTLVPDSADAPYNMLQIITTLCDDDEFLEVHALFATNLIVGYGRIEGRSVGFVANQPLMLAGTIDIDASDKAARFVRTCDAYNIPIISLADTPGYLPGKDQEMGGVLRHGAKLLYAYIESQVPKLTVITRKAYGGAYGVMGSKHARADMVYAWPTAQIAVMGASSSVTVLERRRLKAAKEAGEDVRAVRKQLENHYEETLANPWIAAERGYVDAVIEPSQTRRYLAQSLRLMADTAPRDVRRRHGNIPL